MDRPKTDLEIEADELNLDGSVRARSSLPAGRDVDDDIEVEDILPPPRPDPVERDVLQVETDLRAAPAGLARTARIPALAGILVVLLFFGGFGVWAATAPLAGAAIASGTIIPNTSAKSIAHLEGGIVSQIDVREGSIVKSGDVLLKFSDVKARSTYEQDSLKHFQLDATRIRLESELDYLAPGSTAVDDAIKAAADPLAALVVPPPQELAFPAETEATAKADPAYDTLLDGERRQFDARWRAYISQVQLYEQTIAKSRVDIEALTAQVDTIKAQAAFLDQELVIIQGLVDKNLDTQSRLLELKRQRLQSDEDVAALNVRIFADQQSIRTSQLDIQNLKSKQVQDVTNQLAQARSDLETTAQRLANDRDVLARTTIVAPVDGAVVDLQVHTIGGIVAPGATILTIVPQNDTLIIEAKITPNDIDAVHVGQDVEVILTAYPQRRTPIILGKLTAVSADTIAAANGDPNASYFRGQVEVDPKYLKTLTEDIKFVAGMQVELKIVTEQRTFFDYLLEPILRSMNRSFVEG